MLALLVQLEAACTAADNLAEASSDRRMRAGYKPPPTAGLAANQVDVDLQLFVYDCPDDSGVRHVGHIINPVLDEPDVTGRRLLDDPEGCLSVPGAVMDVPRTDRTVARGFDKDGKPLVIEGTGYFARCLQHETDHLLGRVYLDRLSKRDRKDALRQMNDRQERVFAHRAARAARLDR
jgi:peptide deformylase